MLRVLSAPLPLSSGPFLPTTQLMFKPVSMKCTWRGGTVHFTAQSRPPLSFLRMSWLPRGSLGLTPPLVGVLEGTADLNLSCERRALRKPWRAFPVTLVYASESPLMMWNCSITNTFSVRLLYRVQNSSRGSCKPYTRSPTLTVPLPKLEKG